MIPCSWGSGAPVAASSVSSGRTALPCAAGARTASSSAPLDAEWLSPDGADPTLYDYARLDQGLPFKNLIGEYTRFGDVRDLLSDADDRFVIMGRGEELALEFPASGLPVLEEGWSRTFVLHSDGYCKDMDLYTAFPNSVEPLPYHGMGNYPPPERPEKAEEDYRLTWNTRRFNEGGR